jgi:hypothetical protein
MFVDAGEWVHPLERISSAVEPATTRKLRAKWNAEASEDLRSLHGIDEAMELERRLVLNILTRPRT